MNAELERFGDHLRRLRHERGLSQEELATRAQLSVDTISRLEGGATSPRLATLRRLCAGFDLTLPLLFEGYESGERDRFAELEGFVQGCSDEELDLVIRVVRALLDRGTAVG